MQTLKDDADLHSYLEPHQISVGTAGGLEAGFTPSVTQLTL